MTTTFFKYKVEVVSNSNFKLKGTHFLLLYSHLAKEIQSTFNKDAHKIIPFSNVLGVSKLFKFSYSKFNRLRVFKNEKLYFYVLSFEDIKEILYHPINIKNIQLCPTNVTVKKYNLSQVFNYPNNNTDYYIKLGSIIFPIQLDIDKFYFGASEVIFRFSVFLSKFLNFPKIVVLDNKKWRKILDNSIISYKLRFFYYKNKYKWFIGYFQIPFNSINKIPLYNVYLFLTNIFLNKY